MNCHACGHERRYHPSDGVACNGGASEHCICTGFLLSPAVDRSVDSRMQLIVETDAEVLRDLVRRVEALESRSHRHDPVTGGYRAADWAAD